MPSQEQIEEEMRVKGLNAPRITQKAIEAKVVGGQFIERSSGIDPYAVFNGTIVTDAFDRLTICILVMQNGFTVVGYSSCISTENYNQELGRKIAHQRALDQVFALEAYAARDRGVS